MFFELSNFSNLEVKRPIFIFFSQYCFSFGLGLLFKSSEDVKPIYPPET